MTSFGQEIITDFAQRGIAIHVEGDGIRVRAPAGALNDADRALLREYKPDIIAVLQRPCSPDQEDTEFVLDGEKWLWCARVPTEFAFDAADFAEYSEACWAEVWPEDHVYLTGPRNFPEPCPWCRGRLTHAATCKTLQAEWKLATPLPMGRYRGKAVGEVKDLDYLRWMRTHHGVSKDVREAIIFRLELATKERVHDAANSSRPLEGHERV